MGMIGPRMGKHWIIENCTITNARCVGIILGHAPGVDYSDIDAFGDHIVRNNVIRRCGQAGIAGQKGATRSLIEGNLIEQTNYRKEFGGWFTPLWSMIDANLMLCRTADDAVRELSDIPETIDFRGKSYRLSGEVIAGLEQAAAARGAAT